MYTMWRTVYSYGVIPLLWLFFRALGLVNRKARRAIQGRVGMMDDLKRQLERLPAGKRVWFHSSSLGEFEQAKPIIAELKRRHPKVRVIATFFSPSGYDHSRKYQLVDVVSYLPFDSQSGASTFVDAIRPDVAVMVRYDIWPNHIWALRERGIPTMIANATMRSTTPRRVFLAKSFHHHVYNAIDHILTVSESDAQAFRQFDLERSGIHAIGDTRYDQVSQRSSEAKKRRIIPESVLSGRKVIVAGSTWPDDESVLIHAVLGLAGELNTLLILVPHEPTVDHLDELENELLGMTTFIRFSALNEYNNERVIIVDSIGILMTLYAYADIAYVGGSFRQGVHNVLEAAVYGIPVLFGPRHRNSQEPLKLVERGGGFVVNDTAELQRALDNLLEDDTARKTAGERAGKFVQANVGATERFLEYLEPHITTGPQ
ncbi:MAG: 3-deoxy-D-manno-octulosonic acid transferase [Bacteroidota bacterium]